MKTKFWTTWLKITGILLTIFGLCMAFFSNTVVFNMLNNAVDTVFFKEAIPDEFIQFRTWIYAVLGSTIAGWGIFISFIAGKIELKNNSWAWNALLTATLVWYIPDTFFSFKMGVVVNGWINTIILIALLIPLVVIKILKSKKSEI